MWPSKPTDEINFAFRASGVSILKLRLLPEHFTQSPRSNDAWSSRINGHNPFGYSGFENLNFPTFQPSFAFSELTIHRRVSPSDQRSRSFRVSKLQIFQLTLSFHWSRSMDENAPKVIFQIGHLVSTSGLRHSRLQSFCHLLVVKLSEVKLLE
jgi:hypothetical protein